MGPIPQRGQTVASGVRQAMLVPIPEPRLEFSAPKLPVIFHKKDPLTARHANLEGPAHRQLTLPYILSVPQDFIVMRG